MEDRIDDYRKLLGESFESLFFRYAKGLVVYAEDFSLSREDAEDIVHDVFVNLWEKWDKVSISAMQAYLFRATRNKCLNQISYRKIRAAPNIDSVTNKDLPTEEDADYYVQSELQKLLDDALAVLPPQRKKIFIMHKLEGKSSETIAAELDISPNTVYKHIQLASKDIKEYLSRSLYLLITTALFS